MKNIKKYFQYTLLSLAAMFMFSAATPMASTAQAACKDSVLTFPAWYQGVQNAKCEVKIDQLNDFWIIVMNFIEMFLQVVAYVAAGYIVWGGFKYIKSQGEPAKISEAKMAITNAAIGLVIALGSVAMIEFIQSRIV